MIQANIDEQMDENQRDSYSVGYSEGFDVGFQKGREDTLKHLNKFADLAIKIVIIISMIIGVIVIAAMSAKAQDSRPKKVWIDSVVSVRNDPTSSRWIRQDTVSLPETKETVIVFGKETDSDTFRSSFSAALIVGVILLLTHYAIMILIWIIRGIWKDFINSKINDTWDGI